MKRCTFKNVRYYQMANTLIKVIFSMPNRIKTTLKFSMHNDKKISRIQYESKHRKYEYEKSLTFILEIVLIFI